MAKTLPGSPIVGFYNQAEKDFEEHNKIIEIANGKFNIIENTRPYGFVDLNAKVWFQKFKDDGKDVREYLMTEGYLWTDVYPESKRIVEHGNNQSMELHNKLTKGTWTKDENGMPQFFIINEAVIQKLCILGENVEPCFEGAGIAAEFSFDEGFKSKLFSMMEELKTALQEGEKKMSDENKEILTPESEEEDTEFKKKPDEEEKDKTPENSQKKDNDSSEDNKKTEEEEDEEYKKKKCKTQCKKAEDEDEDEEDICPNCGKPKSKCTCEEDKKKKYNLDDIPEYIELSNKYSALEQEKNALEVEVKSLREFKMKADRLEKQAMIDSFSMLSDADKADVVANIDTYSVNDIEAKLSIICVRNKVNFNLDKENKETDKLIYSLKEEDGNDGVPAWIKAVRDTAKSMN